MRLLSTLAVVPLLAVGETTAASEGKPEDKWDDMYVLANGAFMCMFIAGYAAEDSPMRNERQRLFKYGYDTMKAVLSALKADPSLAQSLGSWAHEARNFSEEFWTGAAWMRMHTEVESMIEREALSNARNSDGNDKEALERSIAQIAETQFERAGCEGIGVEN